MHGATCTFVAVLEGECNCCGMCCTFLSGGRRLFCQYLDVRDLAKSGGTSCRVYVYRKSGMPIQMVDEDGNVILDYKEGLKCNLGNVKETVAIVSEGIGKGCSLMLRLSLIDSC